MEYDKLVDDTLDSIQKPLYEIDHDKMLETINWMVEKYGARDTRRFIKREGWLNGMPKNMRRSFNERLFTTQSEGFWSDLAKPRKLTPEEIAANKKKKKKDLGKAARIFGGGTYGVAVASHHRAARGEDIEFEDALWLDEGWFKDSHEEMIAKKKEMRRKVLAKEPPYDGKEGDYLRYRMNPKTIGNSRFSYKLKLQRDKDIKSAQAKKENIEVEDVNWVIEVDSIEGEMERIKDANWVTELDSIEGEMEKNKDEKEEEEDDNLKEKEDNTEEVQEALIQEGECFKSMMKKEGIASISSLSDEQKKIFFKKVKEAC